MYVSDMWCRKYCSSPQPSINNFDFRPAVPPIVPLTGYAFVLASKNLSVSTDCQRHFDLI